MQSRAPPSQKTKEVVFTHFDSLCAMIKLFFASRRMSPSLSGREIERIYWARGPAVACRAGCHSARTTPSQPPPSPAPSASLPPLVLGSRFPPLTGKTYLEGGLKGLQSVSDRGCLAADVAGLMCHSAGGGPERGGGAGQGGLGGLWDISRNSRLALTARVQVPSALQKGIWS